MTEEVVQPQETAATPKPAKKTRRVISDKLKAEAIAMWQTGEYKLSEIAAKTGIESTYWNRFFVMKKLRKGTKAKELNAKREAALTEALTLDPAVYARRVFDTKNETYRILEMLRKMVAKTIVESSQKGLPVGSTQNDMKAIREAAAAIKICREEAYAVLGISPDDVNDDQLPQLTIEDLTEEQIESLQVQEGELEAIVGGDLPVEDDEIVVEGDGE